MKYIITTIITILILGMLAISSAAIAYLTDDITTITVNEKERIMTGSGENMSSKYLIFTEQGVYQNTDTIWYWKWNSSDVYNQLKEGQEYEVKVYGFRVPFLSWYKNIVEIY